MKKSIVCVFAVSLSGLGGASTSAGAAEPPVGAGMKSGMVMRTAQATGENPFAAGKAAAEALRKSMGNTEIKAVFYAECFEDKANKEELLKGMVAVLGADKLIGGSVYGTYTQQGVLTEDAVALLGIGGDDVSVSMALQENMGAAGLTIEKDNDQLTRALGDGGSRLAKQLGGTTDGALLIVLGDAHSPKNQLLLDGIQTVVGKKLPVTGGSVSKNAGQNWLGYGGKLYSDAAVALLIRGKVRVAQTGRQAKENDLVIATAKEGSVQAVKQLGKEPTAVIAFDCAGRKGKLQKIEDEWSAIQSAIGTTTTLFGCYCAGEFGPADIADVADKSTVYGCGWHVMFTAVAQ